MGVKSPIKPVMNKTVAVGLGRLVCPGFVMKRDRIAVQLGLMIEAINRQLSVDYLLGKFTELDKLKILINEPKRQLGNDEPRLTRLIKESNHIVKSPDLRALRMHSG